MQGISQEEDGGTDDEPFPTEGDDTKGNTGQCGVCKGSLSMRSNVVEGTDKGKRVRRSGLGNASGASILHRSKPVHETDRDEEHHEGVVVCERPGRVGDVGGHEGDEPSCENTSTLAEVILGHGGDGEDGQCTVNGWEAEHAPPHGVLSVVEERLKCHGTDGHGPREERRTGVDTTDGVEAVCIDHEVSIVGEDVIHNALHVPGVRTTGHVPVPRAKGVHGRYGVPLNTNGKPDEEGQADHHACSVSTEEKTSLRGLVLAEVGPAAVALVVAQGVDSHADEERDGKPDEGAPGAVEVLGVPDTGFKPSSHLVECPHRSDHHGTGVPSLSDHAGDDQRDHTGQEGAPVAEVAVVARFGGDTELVEGLNAVEVPQRPRKGEDPNTEGHHQRERRTVVAAGLPEEGKPSFLAGRVERAASEHTGQKAGSGKHGPVRKEDVRRCLALEVHGRDQLAAFHFVGGGQRSIGIASRCDGQPESDGGEGHGGHPLVATSKVEVRANHNDQCEHESGQCVNIAHHVERFGTDKGQHQHAEGNGGGRQIGLRSQNQARHHGQHACDGDDQHRHHVVHCQVVFNAHDSGGGKSEQHGQGCEQQPQRGTWLNRLRIHLFIHLYPSF